MKVDIEQFNIVSDVVDEHCFGCSYIYPPNTCDDYDPKHPDPCEGCHIRGLIDAMETVEECAI